MLTFETKSGIGTVENSWGELSPLQFIETVALTNQFVAGAFSHDEYRLRLLEKLTGYKRKTSRSKHAEQINENLFLISEQLNFAVLPDVGPPEVLEFFSPKLRELLETRFPWEIFEPEHVAQIRTVQNILQVNFKVNFNLGKNPLPFLRKENTLFRGPVFTTTDDDIYTDLKAGQYLDAAEYFNAYAATKNEKYLNGLLDCLYDKNKGLQPLVDDVPDDDVPVDDVPDDDVPVNDVPDISSADTRDAIIMLFIYIQQTFANDPVFGILFNQSEPVETGKLHLGSDESIGMLVEAGYGNHNEVSNLDIRTFFNYQIRFIRKNVNELRSMKKSSAEIAKMLNMNIETVQKL